MTLGYVLDNFDSVQNHQKGDAQKMFTLTPMPQSWRMVQCALCAHKKYPFTNNIQAAAAAKNNVKVNCGDQKAYIQQEIHKR